MEQLYTLNARERLAFIVALMLAIALCFFVAHARNRLALIAEKLYTDAALELYTHLRV